MVEHDRHLAADVLEEFRLDAGLVEVVEECGLVAILFAISQTHDRPDADDDLEIGIELQNTVELLGRLLSRGDVAEAQIQPVVHGDIEFGDGSRAAVVAPDTEIPIAVLIGEGR